MKTKNKRFVAPKTTKPKRVYLASDIESCNYCQGHWPKERIHNGACPTCIEWDWKMRRNDELARMVKG
jgi:hypothetical protein